MSLLDKTNSKTWAVRTWLVENGVGPLSAHQAMKLGIEKNHNPYGGDQNHRGDWWPAEVPKYDVPDVILYAGCTGSFRQQQVPRTAALVLNRAGVKMNILGKDEWCCMQSLESHWMPAGRRGLYAISWA